MEDLTGKTIRGYELLERIGEGGFGVVYRAFQPAVKREVVVKAILPIYVNNADFIRNFEAEAQLIARLEHLHIVPLYDYWREPEGAFLIMRWLRGGSLNESLAQGPWETTSVIKLLDQIAGALTVAHRNQVIHQDIKPANILLDDEGNAYLSDFGLAKDIQQDLDLSVSVSTTSVRGSPAYISPEQIKRSVVTPQTDIYSLGIVLYELLCGEHPFDIQNIVDLLRNQLNLQLPAVHEKRPDLPDKLNIVLWRATAKDPEARYDSVLDLAAEFKQTFVDFQSTIPITATETTLQPGITESVTGLIDLAAIDALAAGPPNPYKGLRAFQEADAADFFGRDALVQTLLERIKETNEGHRFLAVVGPSGSGKSSVVRAGLVPAIRSQWRQWYIVTLTPGTDSLNELANAIQGVITASEHPVRELLQAEDGLFQAVANGLPDAQNDLVLIIDQFEEVFTHSTDDQQQAHFLKLIHYAVTTPGSRLHVVITLRADFYDRPLLFPGFGQLMRQRTEIVLPLDDEGIIEAVHAPAQRVGLSLETGLIEKLIADVADQPGILPLMQFTLTELYEQRQGDELTLTAYQAIGGVTGALARRADELYQPMTWDQRDLTRQLFLRLVTPGAGTEDTRRRSLQSELTSLGTDQAAIERIITHFGKYRLLTFDRDPATRAPTVEIAHEALIRSWNQLREWLNQNRDDLRTQQQLATATQEWLHQDRDPSFLASGVRLALYETLQAAQTIALNEDEQAYVQASMKRRQREERNRQLRLIGLVAVSLIVFVLALVAFDQRNRAELARQIASAAESTAVAERDRADVEASISRSRELAASSLITTDQIDLPLLLSLEAIKAADTFQARNSLLTTLQAQPRLQRLLHGHTDSIRTVAYSADGRLIATGSRDNTVTVWERVSGQPLPLPTDLPSDAWINAVAFSPNNQQLAIGKADGTLVLIDLTTNNQRALSGHTDAIWSVDFSPDSQLLVSGSGDNSLQQWDVRTGEPHFAPLRGHENTVYVTRYSPDGSMIASGSADGTIRLWDATTLVEQQRLTGHTNWVLTLDFSHDGQQLASGSADGTLRRWDLTTNEASSTPSQGHTDWVRSVQFSPEGQRIISGGADGLILIWDAASGELQDGFANIAGSPVWSVAVSPDSQHIITGGELNALPVWSFQPKLPLGSLVTTTTEQILTVQASTDGEWLAYAGGLETDFAIKLRKNSDGTTQLLNGHTNSVTDLAFHPTEPLLVSNSLDRSVIVWDLETGTARYTLPIAESAFTVAISADGTHLVAGYNSGAIASWRFADLHDNIFDPQILSGHTDRVTALAFHPSTMMLASGSRDHTIRLWDGLTSQMIGEPLAGHTDGVLDLAFHPDGTRLASSSRDTTIQLWSRTEAGWISEEKPLTGHENWVFAVAFSPDGSILASASGDQSIRLWDSVQQQPLGQPLIGHVDWVNAVAFSGNQLYSAGRDGRVVAWETGISQWQSLACSIANRNLSQAESQRYFQGQIPITC